MHAFTLDGANPHSPLIQATDGNFYGTTNGGGASGYGTVFRIDSSGHLTTLHSFASSSSEGSNPIAGLVQATDGNFYGTASNGGSGSCLSGCGTVFKMDLVGNLTTLHSFTGSDGVGPSAGLIQATDGNFYGTTSGGGANGAGTVFKIDSAGNLTMLHSFAISGGFPHSGLI